MAICLPASMSSPRWFLQMVTTRIRGTSTINVKEGETYSFTAVWQGQDLALVKNE